MKNEEILKKAIEKAVNILKKYGRVTNVELMWVGEVIDFEN